MNTVNAIPRMSRMYECTSCSENIPPKVKCWKINLKHIKPYEEYYFPCTIVMVAILLSEEKTQLID